MNVNVTPELEEQDDLKQVRLEELRREIRNGLDSLDRGEGKPLDIEAIKAQGRQRLVKVAATSSRTSLR